MCEYTKKVNGRCKMNISRDLYLTKLKNKKKQQND